MKLSDIEVMLSDQKVKKINEIFSQLDEVEAVYLFGSSAVGSRISNDIDLGIVTSGSPEEKDKLPLYTEFTKKGLDDIDLVFFKTAGLVLQFEIIHHNKLIYSKKGFNHGNLFSNTVRKYFDFKPILELHRKVYKSRVLNGSA